jgi:hypothetical protein
MALILAIEPDRRQAARITALARNPLNVELVVTDSAERALASIAERVPDLILTPKLFSSKDESILDARLRQLDANGQHVQTLMIPMLSSGRNSSKKESGLLNRLRWSSEEESSDGCDPAVFAAEIAQYLERAAADRTAKAAREESAREAAEHAAVDARPTADVAPVEPSASTSWSDLPLHATDAAPSEDVVIQPEEVTAHVDHVEAHSAIDVTSHQTLEAEVAEPIPAQDELVAEFSVDPDLWTRDSEGRNGSEAPASRTLTAGQDDEWGFFDPDRVGFAALIAKLQEVTE